MEFADLGNNCEIRSEGKRVRSAVAGMPMINYEQCGQIGLQGPVPGQMEIDYTEITVEELPQGSVAEFLKSGTQGFAGGSRHGWRCR
jgi:hypothetical protein